MASKQELSLRALVRGRVQGVGFRWFIQEEASRLGLAGWVRNLPGGEVEFEAQGKRPPLEALLRAAGQGPASSRVDGVDSDWIRPTKTIEGFDIRG